MIRHSKQEAFFSAHQSFILISATGSCSWWVKHWQFVLLSTINKPPCVTRAKDSTAARLHENRSCCLVTDLSTDTESSNLSAQQGRMDLEHSKKHQYQTQNSKSALLTFDHAATGLAADKHDLLKSIYLTEREALVIFHFCKSFHIYHLSEIKLTGRTSTVFSTRPNLWKFKNWLLW